MQAHCIHPTHAIQSHAALSLLSSQIETRHHAGLGKLSGRELLQSMSLTLEQPSSFQLRLGYYPKPDGD